MTSILKQNTVCFALPLCRKYRQWDRAVSIAIVGNVQLEKYSDARRETVMVVAVLSAPSRVASTGGSGSATGRRPADWSDDI
jgi:hypothetical protein